MRFGILFFVIFLIHPQVSFGADGRWFTVSLNIEKALNESLKTYERGNVDEAIERASDAYFSIFEGEEANMEIAIRQNISLKKATQLEKGFGDIRRAFHDRKPAKEIKKSVKALSQSLKDAAKTLDKKGVR